MDYFSRFLPVGFYYKTFFRPAGIWKYFERPIRIMAGLGTLDPRADHKYYDKEYLFADVVVVGSGPLVLKRRLRRPRAARIRCSSKRCRNLEVRFSTDASATVATPLRNCAVISSRKRGA